jgi:hypothetical protein
VEEQLSRIEHFRDLSEKCLRSHVGALEEALLMHLTAVFICVLILLYIYCPHTTVYLSALLMHLTAVCRCVLILLYIYRAHTTVCLSALARRRSGGGAPDAPHGGI